MSAADVLTLARFPLALAIAVVAVVTGVDGRAAVIVLAVLAAATDVADGWLARRSGTASARGARWDSLADGALVIALLVALAAVIDRDEWEPWVLWGLGAVVVVRAVVAVVRIRRRAPAIDHTILNKAAGAVGFVAVIVALATGEVATWVTAAALVVAMAAALDELRDRAAAGES